MNAPNARRGGLEVWAPSVLPPIGVELSNEQALAVARRLVGDAVGGATGQDVHPRAVVSCFKRPYGGGGIGCTTLAWTSRSRPTSDAIGTVSLAVSSRGRRSGLHAGGSPHSRDHSA